MRRPAGWPRRPGAAVVVAVGAGAAPVLDGARAAGGWQGEAIAVPDARSARRGACRTDCAPATSY